MYLQKNSIVEDQSLKHQRVMFELKVVSHATPSSKSHMTDLPGVCVLASEGKLTELAAVEDITGGANYVAPSDADGKINVILKKAELGTVEKVMKVVAHEKDAGGTFTLAPCKVTTAPTAGGLTAAGNIAFSIDSGIDLSAADATISVVVDYLLKK